MTHAEYVLSLERLLQRFLDEDELNDQQYIDLQADARSLLLAGSVTTPEKTNA